nr:uncharacterized protein LOC121117543 [Lepeophtheirus salmonis]
MLSEESLSILDSISDVPKNLLKMMQIGSGIKGSGSSYSPELRAFALTFLSTIRNLYSNVDRDPGFTQSSFDILKSKANKALESKEEILVNLTLDGMSIFKKIQWNGEKFDGYVR